MREVLMLFFWSVLGLSLFVFVNWLGAYDKDENNDETKKDE